MKRALALVLLLLLQSGFAQQMSPALRDQMQKGSALQREGKLDEALAEYQRAAKMDPNSPNPYLAMASAYQRKGAHEQAIENARRALQLASSPPFLRGAHFLLGVSLEALGDEQKDVAKCKEAEQELRAALALETAPGTPPRDLRYHLGMVLMRLGRTDEGVQLLKQYVKAQPNTTLARKAQQAIDNRYDPPEPADPVLDPQLQKAQDLMASRRYDDAIREYKRAAKLKSDSARPYLGLAEAYQTVGAYKDCLQAARRAAELTTNRVQLTNAHNLAGVALSKLGDEKGDLKRYMEAEDEFRAAIDAIPDSAIAYFNLGTILLKQGRDDDGFVELKRYLEDQPNGKFARQAERFLENPRRARENFLPEFSLVTMDGTYLNSDELQGKVLVLDFWASWCAPCRDAVGELQRFYRKFPKDQVLLISISADSDEQAWRQFVATHKMEWMQYWDRDHKIQNLFNVHAFPSYLIVDSEGVIHRWVVGNGRFQASAVEDEVKRCLKAAGKKL